MILQWWEIVKSTFIRSPSKLANNDWDKLAFYRYLKRILKILVKNKLAKIQ